MTEEQDATRATRRWFEPLGDSPANSARATRAGELVARVRQSLGAIVGANAADAWASLLVRPLRLAASAAALEDTIARTAGVLATLATLLGGIEPGVLTGERTLAIDALPGAADALERIALGTLGDDPGTLLCALRPALAFETAAVVTVDPHGGRAVAWSAHAHDAAAYAAFASVLAATAGITGETGTRVEIAAVHPLAPSGSVGGSDGAHAPRVVAVPLTTQGEVAALVVLEAPVGTDLAAGALRFATAAVQVLAPRLLAAASNDPWRGQLLSVISHDLRNPLSAILMSVSLLLRGRRNLTPEERTDVDRQLDVIKRSAERMNQLIQNLLDAVTLDQHPLEIERRACDVGALVTEALRFAHGPAASKSVRIETTLDPTVESVVGDRERLVQCIANLVVTAVKLVGRSGVVSVQVMAESGTAVRFVVSQSGPGLSTDEALRLFERSSWSGRDSRIGAGTGLGLTVARGIVLAHGAVLEILGGDSVAFTFAIARDAHSTSNIAPQAPDAPH